MRQDDKSFTLCGTPAYLAPEVVTSAGHGFPVDWWALGVLLYELLVGETPFVEASSIKIYQKILAGKVTFPSSMKATAKELIMKLLVASPSRRLGSGGSAAAQMKSEPFFRIFDFPRLEEKKYDAPWKPQLKHGADNTYFSANTKDEADDLEVVQPAFEAIHPSFQKDLERLDREFSHL